MGDGAGKPNRVIDPQTGGVHQYIGIGWIRLRDATSADTELYPVLTDA